MTAAAKAASKYVDGEVVQRLLKALDFIVFFSLALTFLCLLLLRDLGLYKTSALVKGNWTSLKSAATLIITGCAAYKALDYFLIPLEPRLLLDWTLAITAYLALTRMVAQAWARPIAGHGRFRKRIAIVGGGRVADDALHALEASH